MNKPAFCIAAALIAALCLVPCAAHADTHYVPDEGTIQVVIALADPGDEVVVRAGTYTLSSTVAVNKANLTLRGEGSSSTFIQVAYGIGYAFSISANGVTLEDFRIEKTDKTGPQNLVYIGADDVTVRNNLIFGKYVLGDGDVSRAMEVAYGSTGLAITGNTIHSLRQPAYMNGSLAAPTTGTVSGNHVYGTRGWVIDGANMSFTGNTWGSGAQTNYLDIAILAATPAGYYPDIVAISAANNDAVVEDQRAVPAVLSDVFVDDGAAGGGDGTVTRPYQTISAAIPRAVAGGTVNVAEGTYEEQVEIAKTLTLDGDGAGTIIRSPVTLTKSFMTSAVNKPVVYVHDAVGVVIKELTVDGAGRGNANYRFYGIAFRNAGGTVDHCSIINITDTPFSGAQHGVAVYTYNDDGVSRAVNVWDNTIHGFQKNGMALNASATTPLAVDVRRNTVTGAGPTSVTAQNGIQVMADMGSGTVADNVVTGIGYSGTGWVATSILGYYADLAITGNAIGNAHMGIYTIIGACNISDNTLAMTKIGSYCYGICASDPPEAIPSPFGETLGLGGSRPMLGAPLSTLDVDIVGNTVTFSGGDNTNTIGIEVDAGYKDYYGGGGDENIDVTVRNNVVSGFSYGIGFYQCASDCGGGVFTNIAANYNSIVGNTAFGMESNATYIMADGRYNWWGHQSGPYHHALNPSGMGNPVSDNVIISPFFDAENVISVIPTSTLTNCGTARIAEFHIDQAGPPNAVRGYEVKFQVNTAVAAVTGITEGTFLSSVGPTYFYVLPGDPGIYTVSCAILGASGGGTGHGTLFLVELTPAGEGTSPIDILSTKVRDLNNVPLPSGAIDGSIQVDCTAPTMEPIAEAQGGWYNAAPVFTNFGFDDDVDLDLAEYNYDGGAWTAIFTGWSGAAWDNDPWTLPGFDGLSQGSHTINFRVKDDAGNWNTETYSWQFYKDTVAPAPPTNFVAMPGHNKTHLSWTNPPGDPTFAGVEIRFNRWNDYPEYAAPAPVYPPDAGSGTPVAFVSGTSCDHDPCSPRDIYYYAAFSKDLAGNYSTLGDYAKDRCTNYWLGDVDASFDGFVGTADLVVFSGAFGTIQNGGGWDNDCDFGPTDDWSRLGIPLPDDKIDFEDLMIFAMNWGVVTPAGLSELAAAARPVESLEKLVRFELVSNDDGSVSIVLSNGASTLKGVRIVVAVEDGALERVVRGSLFSGAAELFFGLVPAARNAADISAAALGIDVPLAASGELARLVVRSEGETAPRVRIAAIDLRDLSNAKTEIVSADEPGVPLAPKATVLLQNFPNPFNPVTTLAYDLAEAGHVRIDIYDVSGRLIATPVDASKAAGRHHAEWNGRDASGSLVPSGIYFYRMKTAGFEATRKMILIR